MKRRHAIVGALAAGAFSLATATVAMATTDVAATRLAGTNRYDTSRAVADATFGTDTTVAVMASGENFPDALAANYLAGASDAPVILTAKGQLSPEAKTALEAVGATGVLLVGGSAAVSEDVVAQLETAGYTVDRIAGGDRYATAQAVAESVPEESIGSLDADVGRTALLASGNRFPDALAGGPLSYHSAFPMLLTSKMVLPDQTKQAIQNLGIEEVVILGGDVAISPEVEAEVLALGVTVRRVEGANRMGTATAIADLAVSELGFAVNHANIARGDEFADALSGGPHAGTETTPILLTATPDVLGAPTKTWLQDHSDTLTTLHVFGGSSAVSDATVDEAEVAAGRTP